MMSKKVKIVLLGDSITQGIGSRQINYEKMLGEYLINNGIENEIVNLALTGTTIEYALNQITKIEKINPDYVVIMYGSVDLQVRPNMETNKWGILSLTPKRYKDIKGMLNPRPFMSSRKGRYIVDCIDNLYRMLWKKVVVATQGTMQYLTEEQFEIIYREVLKKLEKFRVVCCSTMYVDSKIYTNRTTSNYEQANNFLKILESKYSNVVGYVDLYYMQKTVVSDSFYNEIFCQDHFHPNKAGYKKISEALGAIIISDLIKTDKE